MSVTKEEYSYLVKKLSPDSRLIRDCALGSARRYLSQAISGQERYPPEGAGQGTAPRHRKLADSIRIL